MAVNSEKPGLSVTILRRSLIDRLNGSLARLTIVEAPAGYGKTTAMRQLRQDLDAAGVLTVWHGIDDYPPGAEQFLRDMALSLHANGLPINVSEDAIKAGLVDSGLPSIVNFILEALAGSRGRVVLFIDDYHKLGPSPVDQMLSAVLERMPDHCSVVIGTREKPSLQFYLFRSRGAIATVGKNELQFSRDEARAYFGEAFDETLVGSVVRRTEGWPAALQLTKLCLIEGRTTAAVLGGPDVALPDIADYLAEQIFERLDASVKSFLVRSSILDRLCGELVNEVCEVDDGWAVLEQLESRNLLTFPLDADREWFRYHNLFSTFLRRRLRRLPGAPADMRRMHERAARWFGANGYLREALHHAATIGAPALALELLENAGGWRLALAGGVDRLRDFSDWNADDPTRFPRAHLGRVYLLAQSGRMADARRELTPLLAATELPLGSRAEAEMMEIILRIYEDREIAPAAVEHLEERLSAASPDPVLRGLARNLVLASYYDDRDYRKCRIVGEEVLADRLARRLPYADSYIHIYVALAALFNAEFERAARVLEVARAHAAHHFGHPSNVEAICSVITAAILSLEGAQDRASEWLHPALEAVEAVDGWLDVYALGYATAARIEQARGSIDGALAAIDDGRRTAARRRLPRLHDFLNIRAARVLLAAGEVSAAERLWRDRLAPIAELYETGRRHIWIGHELAMCRARLAIALGDQDQAATMMAALTADHRAAGQDLFALDADVLGFYIRHRRLPTYLSEDGVLSRVAGAFLADQGDIPENEKDLMTESRLTRREIDVLRGLSDGCSSKEIARRLSLAESTIKTHRLSLYRKLGAGNRSGVIAAARRIGLLYPVDDGASTSTPSA